jgi:hypothetical protein
MTSSIEDRADSELNALADSDKDDAKRKFNAKLAERKYDAIVDALFLVLDGNVEQRKAKARTDERAEAAYVEYLEAQRAFDELHNERETRKLRFEYCRSVMANQRGR